MTPLIKHIAGGEAFFTGVALIGLAVLIMAHSSRRRGAGVVVATGLLLIITSATPLPRSFYVLAAAITVSWMALVSWHLWRARTVGDSWGSRVDEQSLRQRRLYVVTGLFLGVWLIGAVMEAPYHVMPAIPKASAARLTIFADSVTAGIGEREAITWPALMAAAHPIEVIDRSHMGATAESVTVLAEQHPPQPGIVLLEIGGNDMLGDTTAPEFARTLEALLNSVCGPDRQVVMLELPLPPMFQEYGRIQRRLAKRYDVVLIPKRFLLEVLLSDSTTLDSIHLSQAGHQRMADRLWDLLGPCY